MMYQGIIQTKHQAVVHLLLHCCLKDGIMEEEEIDAVAEIIATIHLHKDLSVKQEIKNYQAYATGLDDEAEFVEFLVRLIKPDKPLALFSICVELCVSDNIIATSEATLLAMIASALKLDPSLKRTVEMLVMELQALDVENEF